MVHSRRRLRGKFGGAAAATARLLGARWRRGAQGADPEAGRRGRSRAEGAARGEAGRRRPGPRACRSPPPAPRAAAAPAPAGGARGATSLPPLPPRGPRGGPERPCLGPGSGARLLGWGASGERSPEAGRELPPPRAHLRARPEETGFTSHQIQATSFLVHMWRLRSSRDKKGLCPG